MTRKHKKIIKTRKVVLLKCTRQERDKNADKGLEKIYNANKVLQEDIKKYKDKEL